MRPTTTATRIERYAGSIYRSDGQDDPAQDVTMPRQQTVTAERS